MQKIKEKAKKEEQKSQTETKGFRQFKIAIARC